MHSGLRTPVLHGKTLGVRHNTFYLCNLSIPHVWDIGRQSNVCQTSERVPLSKEKQGNLLGLPATWLEATWSSELGSLPTSLHPLSALLYLGCQFLSWILFI